jgi:DNA-binding transcriptional MocR family regulator
MSQVSLWKARIVDGARTKSEGIADALEADLRAGRIGPGDRLPPQRAIAKALGVDLTTVTRAFNEAHRRGLISARAGRGSFVRPDLDSARAPGRLGAGPSIDLSMNSPPQPSAANLRGMIPQTIAEILAAPRGLHHLHYQESAGGEDERTAAAAWLGRRMDPVEPSRVVVASGAQAALYGVCRLLLRRGEVIAAGSVTYPGLHAVAGQLGLAASPLAMDSGGISPDAFEAVCRGADAKALYVIPSIDNPTTATLSEDRRRQLAAIARRHGVWIIEDDPYAPLRDEVRPPFASLAADITWHVATLSKCATPALRVAYVVAPDAAQAQRLAGGLRATTLMAPPLMAALAARWIAEGAIETLTAAIRLENLERQKLASEILSEARFAADPHGHHLWLAMPSAWRAADFAEQADRSGVSIVPSSAFAVGGAPAEAVRLSLGVAPDRPTLEDGLKLLAGLLAEPTLAARAVV